MHDNEVDAIDPLIVKAVSKFGIGIDTRTHNKFKNIVTP